MDRKDRTLRQAGLEVLAVRYADEVRLLSADGADLIAWFPEIYEALALLPALVLKGELVSTEDARRSNGLRSRLGLKRGRAIAKASMEAPATLLAFDLLEYKGKDLHGDPPARRQSLLKRALRHALRIEYHARVNGHRVKPVAESLQTMQVFLTPSRHQ